MRTIKSIARDMVRRAGRIPLLAPLRNRRMPPGYLFREDEHGELHVDARAGVTTEQALAEYARFPELPLIVVCEEDPKP